MKPIWKQKNIVSKKIRGSARGETCTLNTPECSGDRETVVFCHAPSVDSGVGIKSPDWWGAYGCSGCHAFLDGHKCDTAAEYYYWWHGIYRTLKRLVAKELIVIK